MIVLDKANPLDLVVSAQEDESHYLIDFGRGRVVLNLSLDNLYELRDQCEDLIAVAEQGANHEQQSTDSDRT